MEIKFELPDEDAKALESGGTDLSRRAKEALLADLYRRDEINHDQLSNILGLSFHETEQFIKSYHAGHGIEREEFEAESFFLRQFGPR